MKNVRNIGKRTFQTDEVALPPKGIARISDALCEKLLNAYPDEIAITDDAPNVKNKDQVDSDKKAAKAAEDAEKAKLAKQESARQKQQSDAEQKKKAAQAAADKKKADEEAAAAAAAEKAKAAGDSKAS